MKMLALILLFPSVGFTAEAYKCAYHDQETGYKAYANVNVNGATADVVVGFDGAPENCKNTSPLAVTGQKPVLTLAGLIGCEGQTPDDVSLVLNTSKKTLEMGGNLFSCK